MSMICNLRQVNNARIDELLAEPEGIGFFLYGPQPAAAPPKPGFFARILGRRQPAPTEPTLIWPVPSGDPATWTPPAAGEEIDLDKSWHGLHYLLTGSDWAGEEPWCYLAKGGTEIGKVDVGYGPARALHSHQVRAFHEALSSITPETLAQRYDPHKMLQLGIYPTIWDRDPRKDDAFDYLKEYFHILVRFLQQAVDRDRGLLIWCN